MDTIKEHLVKLAFKCPHSKTMYDFTIYFARWPLPMSLSNTQTRYLEYKWLPREGLSKVDMFLWMHGLTVRATIFESLYEGRLH